MRNRLFCGIVVLLAVFVATNLHAQDTGTITGTVRDNTGAVIQGADVKISGTAGGIERRQPPTPMAIIWTPVCRAALTT